MAPSTLQGNSPSQPGHFAISDLSPPAVFWVFPAKNSPSNPPAHVQPTLQSQSQILLKRFIHTAFPADQGLHESSFSEFTFPHRITQCPLKFVCSNPDWSLYWQSNPRVFLLCKKLLNMKKKGGGEKKRKRILRFQWDCDPKKKKLFTCFDTVYGEGIFEKVKLHAEYT